MVKYCFLVVALLSLSQVFAQSSDEELAVKKVVEDFFKAFHAQDSLRMKKVVGDNVLLQTTGKNKDGKTMFQTQKIEKLYRSIVAIPDSVQFQEKLTSWSIQVDRTMANAWVGYEFWINDKFSHCGINSFQMVNFDGDWKIVYLIDTRGRVGCLEK